MFATWKTWIWLVVAAIAVIILAGAAANGAGVTTPTLVSSDPVNGARNISVYQWINVSFNENICQSDDPQNLYLFSIDREPLNGQRVPSDHIFFRDTSKRGFTIGKIHQIIPYDPEALNKSAPWALAHWPYNSVITLTYKPGAMYAVGDTQVIDNVSHTIDWVRYKDITNTDTYVLKFYTEPGILPVKTEPESGAKNVPVYTDVIVTFNRDIAPDADYDKIRIVPADNKNYSIPVNTSIKGNILTIHPVDPLESNKKYIVRIAEFSLVSPDDSRMWYSWGSDFNFTTSGVNGPGLSGGIFADIENFFRRLFGL
jgi:hypothetical protein